MKLKAFSVGLNPQRIAEYRQPFDGSSPLTLSIKGSHTFLDDCYDLPTKTRRSRRTTD